MKTIKVTWEDIEHGTHVATSCPVALALKRETGKEWYVTDRGFWMNEDVAAAKVWSSPNVDMFVQDFDFNTYDGKKIKPFEFIIDLDA